MKRLIIIVEGQTEEEFVNSIIAPYLNDNFGILSVTPIKIATSAKSKGGFVNYQHLKNDILKRIRERDIVVSMFVDYFRIPSNVPNYASCVTCGDIDLKIQCLEDAIKDDINFPNFIPYIQKHEFEALLFSSNKGFEELYDKSIYGETEKIVSSYTNPEEINTDPHKAPSKRIKNIMNNYEKVTDGNMIALEIGINAILDKCPRFKNWIDILVSETSKN